MPTSRTRRREAGTAILITMLLSIALLGGGAVLVNLQLSSTRSAAVVSSRVKALTCADAGLATARTLVAANYAQWTAGLCNPPSPRGTGSCVIGSATAEPTWLRSPAVDHDLDDDGNDDFVLTLVDNDDESPSNNLAGDNDLQVWVVSTCTRYPDTPVQVMELVRYTPAGTCYDNQKLGCTGGS